MFDALSVAAIVDELNSTLVGGRIQQVAHVDMLTIALEVYSSHRRRWLVLSADNDLARALIVDDRVGVDPERVSPLLLLLRKYARGGRIVGVTQPRYERILRISIAKPVEANNDEQFEDDMDARRGEPVFSEIVVEIMGRRSNIMFIEENGRIRDSIKRVTREMSRVRAVLPGRTYALPPQQDKLIPQNASANDLLRDAVLVEDRLDRWLVGRYLTMSPALSREVAFRAEVPPTTQVRSLQANDASRIISALDQVYAPLDSGEWSPMGYTLPTGNAVASAIRLFSIEAVDGMTARPCRTISEAVSAVLMHESSVTVGTEGRHAARRQRLVEEVEEARARAAQRVRSLEEQATLAEDTEIWRRMGDAIYAATGSVSPGMTEFTTYDGLVVQLDPSLSPSDNAKRYFERYRKGRIATENVPELIEDAQVRLDYMDQLLFMARHAESFDEIESVRHEWNAWQREVRGNLDRGKHAARRAPAATRRPRVFRTERGDTIWAGRSGPQNDQVTFDVANPDDIWLHARNMPGSHVILRWNGTDDDSVLGQAASLAAWYSAGRGSTTVPVDVTRRRFVRKIKGAGPGMVTYRNERTLMARPRDESTLGLKKP